MTPPDQPEIPKSVSLAVKLLWASLAFGIVKIALDPRPLRQGAIGFGIVVLSLEFVVLVLLVVNVARGKNWARLLFLLLFVVGMLGVLPLLADEFNRSPTVGALSVLQTALQGYAMFLIFTQPGASWFRKSQAAETEARPFARGRA